MNLEKELNLAIDIAYQAGNFLSKNGKKLNKPILSENKDIKLEADIKTEELINSLILKESNFPILGEELGESVKDLGDIFWVVDPLDGTANFAKGIPIYCVSIALVEKSVPLLGVIYDFVHNDMYSGSKAHSALLNGNKIQVSKIKEKHIATIATGLPSNTDFSDTAMRRMITDFQSWKKVRMIGSAAMASAYVASGKADFYKEYGIYLWDIAAGAAIVEAAGGKVTLKNLNNKYQVDAFFSNSYLRNEHH